jgi:hypothetical protein
MSNASAFVAVRFDMRLVISVLQFTVLSLVLRTFITTLSAFICSANSAG